MTKSMSLRDSFNFMAAASSEEVEELAESELALLAVPPERAERGFDSDGEILEQELADLDKMIAEKRLQLKNKNAHWSSRLVPLKAELSQVRAELARTTSELEMVRHHRETMPARPPGPRSLMWVEGTTFTVACSLVITVNLCSMVLDQIDPDLHYECWVLDQVFLVFYCSELALRFTLHRHNHLHGSLKIVCWNWLDMLIVVSGVLDQWLAPLLKAVMEAEESQSSKSHTWFSLKHLRALRVFRVIRIIKIVKIFLYSDLSWTEGRLFQTFIMLVICANSIIMGFELDMPWKGWKYIENVLLTIYVFELAVRLKQWGYEFFWHPDDWRWNNVDFTIVLGGILQQWLMPLGLRVWSYLEGGDAAHDLSSGATSFMKMFRMLRICRVVRLIRLFRHIKPLYRLMTGVLEAMSGMQWVLVLAGILLYACAIVFTNLIGHGLIYDDPPAEAENIFGTVIGSMFMLFKIMNDDQSVVDPLLQNIGVQILFCIFMVISNWAVLAILTAVISDNMMKASYRIEAEDDLRQRENRQEDSAQRLVTVFARLDQDQSGDLDQDEFKKVLEDAETREELCQCSGLEVEDLNELFELLAFVNEKTKQKTIKYQHFLDRLQDEQKSASERNVFRLEKQLQVMVQRVDQRFDGLIQGVVQHLGISKSELKASVLQDLSMGESDRGASRGNLTDIPDNSSMESSRLPVGSLTL